MKRPRPAGPWPALLLAGALLPAAVAAPAAQERQAAHPRTCLVLSGGGARGAAHVGVLQALEQQRVPVDCVAGTSMGAIVGGLYASGLSPQHIERILLEMDWADAFDDRPARASLPYRRKLDDRNFLGRLSVGIHRWRPRLPTALIQGQKQDLILRALLLPYLPQQDFDDLPLPFRATATDIETGEAVIMDRGDLPTAILASMAVPGIFAPVEVQGRVLVDGGIAANLPVEAARRMGAERIIAVDISTPLLERRELVSMLEVSAQVSHILVAENTRRDLERLAEADVVLRPQLEGVGSTDFDAVAQTFEPGRRAVYAQAEALRPLSLSPAAYAEHLAAIRRPPLPAPRIAAVELDNRSGIPDATVRAYLHTAPGAPLDAARLTDDLQRLYGLGYFQRVSYDLHPGPGEGSTLVVHTQAKSWGPHYLRLGLNLEDDFEGGSRYNLLAGLLSTEVNRWGAEWKNELQAGSTRRLYSELWQPLDRRGRYFVSPALEARAEPVDVFTEQGERLAEYDVKTLTAGLDLGRQLGRWGELRLGLRYIEGSAEPRIGLPELPEVDIRDGAYRASFAVDTLDNPHFPRRGLLLNLAWEGYRQDLGSRGAADQAELELLLAASPSRRESWVYTLRAAGASGDGGTRYRSFSLGGFLNLSGYAPDSLTGAYLLHSQGVYYRDLRGPARSLGVPVYAGLSLELGQVWPERSQVSLERLRWAGSLFLGAETFLGPVYLAWGQAERGQSALYFYLGQTF